MARIGAVGVFRQALIRRRRPTALGFSVSPQLLSTAPQRELEWLDNLLRHHALPMRGTKKAAGDNLKTAIEPTTTGAPALRASNRRASFALITAMLSTFHSMPGRASPHGRVDVPGSSLRAAVDEAVTRQDVAFDADGALLRGWLYLPPGSNAARRFPAVVMAGGYGTTKEMFTDRFAEVFAAAGLAVLLYDHRGFGASEGQPRQEIDPWRQVEDLRHAITHASSLPAVDPSRIGVWGSSYSGGHALVVAATDRRVRCVAVQVPTTHGSQTAQRRASGDAETALLRRFADERLRRARGEAPTRLRLMGDAASGAVYRSQEAVDWYTAAYQRAPGAVPEVTLRSIEAARGYNPVDFIERISPTPLLMQVAEKDSVTPTDLALTAYARALEPKALRIVPGAGHFDVYERDFDSVSKAATAWFRRYLLNL